MKKTILIICILTLLAFSACRVMPTSNENTENIFFCNNELDRDITLYYLNGDYKLDKVNSNGELVEQFWGDKEKVNVLIKIGEENYLVSAYHSEHNTGDDKVREIAANPDRNDLPDCSLELVQSKLIKPNYEVINEEQMNEKMQALAKLKHQ